MCELVAVTLATVIAARWTHLSHCFSAKVVRTRMNCNTEQQLVWSDWADDGLCWIQYSTLSLLTCFVQRSSAGLESSLYIHHFVHQSHRSLVNIKHAVCLQSASRDPSTLSLNVPIHPPRVISGL
jgi:hypothetical protein